METDKLCRKELDISRESCHQDPLSNHLIKDFLAATKRTTHHRSLSQYHALTSSTRAQKSWIRMVPTP